MTKLETAFSAWKTVPELASDMGVPVQTAYGWRRRRSLPVRHWKKFISLAREKGIDLNTDDLLTA